VDAGDRRALISGLAMERLTLELRTAKLLTQMREGEDLRESAQALIAQSQRLYAASLRRQRHTSAG
jgi:hypothetical protein